MAVPTKNGTPSNGLGGSAIGSPKRRSSRTFVPCSPSWITILALVLVAARVVGLARALSRPLASPVIMALPRELVKIHLRESAT